MGCGLSKNLSSQNGQNSQQSLNADEIVLGLEEVGERLAQHRIQAEVIMAGDALCTVHLRTQSTVPHVVVMADLLTKEAEKVLARAAEEVRTSHPNFPSNWLDFGTLDIDSSIRQRLAHEAAHQGIIVLRNDGLIVYAAPWRYLFVEELDRICDMLDGIGRSPLLTPNASDAAQYLRQVLAPTDQASIDVKQIKNWQKNYGYASRTNMRSAFDAVNASYEESFGQKPIP